MPTTNDIMDSLLTDARQHQLLDAQQLRELGATRFHDVRGLAQHVLKQGWLTPFQVNHLVQSRGRELIIGPYVLMERLGEGATGQVYKARHRRMGRLAAVKIIRPELLTQPDTVARFYREVQATSRLAHPNIVEAYDAGPVGRTHFFAMELLEGTDLDRLVKQRGALPIRHACEFVRQAALGLQHAHAHGLVHRDIKPSNLMVLKGGVLKVLDLGLVHMSRETAATMAATMTENGTMLGTPDYMAPEQAEHTHSVDARADIYSLGATLYYLVGGKVPFPNCSLMQKLLKLQTTEPQAIEKLRPDVPPAVATLIRSMMAKKAKHRPQTADEVVAALTDIDKKPSPSTIWNMKLPGGFGARTEPALNLPSTGRRRIARLLLRRWRWVMGILAASLLIWWVAGLFTGLDRKDWQRIEALAVDAEPETLRQELIAYRLRHPGSPYALQAAARLSGLPSPLDRLGPGQIPAEEQLPGLPRDVVAILGKHRLPNVGGTRTIAFSPTDQLVATLTGTTNSTLQLSHLPSGEMRASWALPGGINAAAIAPGGALVATAGADMIIRLWDGRSGKERGKLEGYTKAVTQLAFSANGALLASGGSDPTVKVWDTAAAKEKSSIASPAMVRGLVFSPDQATLATIGLDRVIRLWDVATSQQRATIQLPSTLYVAGLAFSPDSKTLALSGPDFSVKLFNAANGQAGPVFTGHKQIVHQLAFSPDGQRLATGSYDRSVRLWEVSTGKEMGVFPGHPQMPMMLLAFSGDSQSVLMATHDQTVWQWDMAHAPAVIRGHPEWRTAAAVSADSGVVATGSRSGLICLWDPADREIRTSFHAHPSAITAVAFAPDGKLLATAGNERYARLWDPATGKALATLTAHAGPVTALAFAPDGATLASADQTIQVFDRDGAEQAILAGHTAPVRALAFTPDGQGLISGGDDGTVRCWRNGSLEQTLTVGKVAALAHCPGQLATVVDGDSAIRLWSGTPGSFQPASTLTGHGGPVRALAYSPDAALLASADQGGRIILWKTAGGDKQQEWHLPSGMVQAVSFAVDGRHLLATSGGGTVYLLRRGQ